MGRLEKIVVVTVLFLVAVILGVSLNSGGDEPAGKGPLANGEAGRNGELKNARARRAADAATNPAGAEHATGTAAPGAEAPAGLLSSTVTPVQPPNATPPANAATPTAGAPLTTPGNAASSQPQAPAQFMATRDGLEPTASDDWMLYSWKSGDTFKDLAERYYGSKLHVARLRAANEGRDESKLAPGDKILVAVKPATALDAARAQPGQAPADKQKSWAGGLYEVKSGDVLGTISQQVYGTSKSWKKIYDANRDVIGDNPNTLKVGAKLRIPE